MACLHQREDRIAAEFDGQAYAALSEAGRDAVFALVQAGHYQMLTDEDE